jgi:hypothetical protein
VSQFDVGPADSTPASHWVVHWDADRSGAPIVKELSTAIVGPDPLACITAGPFALALTSGAPTLTIGTDVWTFPAGVAYRPLTSAFFDFLDAIEAVEGTQLVTGTGAAMRALLSWRTPSTFAETLLFRYGVFRSAGPSPTSYADLIPGTRIQIDSAFSQFVPSASGPPVGINGYVIGPPTVAEIVGTPIGTVVANAFLAGNTVPAVQPAIGGAGSVIDVQAAVNARHLRVCFPRVLGPSSGPGDVDLTHNVAVIGAGSFSALANATANYYSGTALPDGATATFLRGRATLTPLIPVTFMGATSYVPVGTSARQVLERVTPLPRIAVVPDGGNVQLARVTAQALLPGGDISAVAGVSLQAPTAGATTDAWDLPLLGGDILTLTQTGQV